MQGHLCKSHTLKGRAACLREEAVDATFGEGQVQGLGPQPSPASLLSDLPDAGLFLVSRHPSKGQLPPGAHDGSSTRHLLPRGHPRPQAHGLPSHQTAPPAHQRAWRKRTAKPGARSLRVLPTCCAPGSLPCCNPGGRQLRGTGHHPTGGDLPTLPAGSSASRAGTLKPSPTQPLLGTGPPGPCTPLTGPIQGLGLSGPLSIWSVPSLCPDPGHCLWPGLFPVTSSTRVPLPASTRAQQNLLLRV